MCPWHFAHGYVWRFFLDEDAKDASNIKQTCYGLQISTYLQMIRSTVFSFHSIIFNCSIDTWVLLCKFGVRTRLYLLIRVPYDSSCYCETGIHASYNLHLPHVYWTALTTTYSKLGHIYVYIYNINTFGKVLSNSLKKEGWLQISQLLQTILKDEAP